MVVNSLCVCVCTTHVIYNDYSSAVNGLLTWLMGFKSIKTRLVVESSNLESESEGEGESRGIWVESESESRLSHEG